jgi:LPXTG-site transpeptidase (sortase) family protein
MTGRLPALPWLVLALFLLVTLALTARPWSDPVEAVGGAALGHPVATCNGDRASLSFSWQPVSGATQQWLDLSLFDNNFAPGTYLPVGPLAAGTSSFTWAGILASPAHFWRINSLTPNGWVSSDLGSFVACGAPALRVAVGSGCGGARVTGDFYWSPLAASGAQQWLDIGADPNFAPGTFAGVGPLVASAYSHRWQGLAANATYVYRINTLTPDGRWHPSAVGNFTAACSGGPQLISTELYGSADTFAFPRLGIRAEVNVRDVGSDGFLGDPAGPWDVVRYNFSHFAGYAGYPGNGGTTILGGHVDYRPNIMAVFWTLRQAQVGDILEYSRGDGQVLHYRVEYVYTVPPDFNLIDLTRNNGGDTLLLLTCNGTFDSAQRQYDQRLVVQASRLS